MWNQFTQDYQLFSVLTFEARSSNLNATNLNLKHQSYNQHHKTWRTAITNISSTCAHMNIKHSSWTESAMKPSIHFFNFAKWNFLSNYLEDIEVDLVFKKSKLQTSKQWLFCGYFEKQPFGGVLRKRCSENMQQIYRTPIPKCDFNKVAKQL